jgi:hypothetical protein
MKPNTINNGSEMPALQRAVKPYREYQATNFSYIKQYSNQSGLT